MPKYHAKDYASKIKAVYVNGKIVEGVKFVDTDAQYVVAYRLRNGCPYLDDEGNVATEEIHGLILLAWEQPPVPA